MLENETKYIKILQSGHTLKIDPKEAIDLIKGNAEFSEMTDQTNEKIDDKSLINLCSGKIIMKLFTLWHQNDKRIIYWCPCTIEDIGAVTGMGFDEDRNKYIKKYNVPRSKQISFLGKDIKKSCGNWEHNHMFIDFIDKYVETEHPVADHMFYTPFFKEREQVLQCFRNTTLSPRPDKKDDTK